MKLLFFIIKRLLGLILILFVLSMSVFAISRALPGDVVSMYVGLRAQPDQIEMARKELGMDKPVMVQYVRYVQKLLKGDMGISLYNHRPVLRDLREKVPMSFELVIFALSFGLLFGLLGGVLACLTEGSFVDQAIKTLSSAAVSIPIFVLALILQIVFFNYLGILPLQGRIDAIFEFTDPLEIVTGFTLLDCLITGNYKLFQNALWHAVLPIASLSLGMSGYIARLTRSCLLEIMSQNYILSARASGVSEWVLFSRYGLRNALSPILTVLGLSVAWLLLMTFFTEIIFNYPGLGNYAVNGILLQDYPVLIGTVLMIAVVFVFSNLITDILRRIIDPRIK